MGREYKFRASVPEAVQLENVPGGDLGACWLCHGAQRVEWSSVDGDEVVEGVYDPCPECEKEGDGA